MVAAFTYPEFGSCTEGVTLRNLFSEAIFTKAKTILARVAATNIVPPMLSPKVISKTLREEEDSKESVANDNANSQIPLSKENLDKLFSKLNLSKTRDWSEGEQKEIWNLITEFGFLFTLDDFELGRTSIVKHSRTLTGETPFKEC